jgi:glycosyltransferase involved in cell wall biosynthesis
LIVTCFSYPHSGGLSRGIRNEFEFFKNKGYDVKIISSTPNKFKPDSITDRSIYIPKWLKGFFYRFCFSLKAIHMIKILKKESEFYFVDCHDVFSYIPIFLLGLNNKSLLTLHSVQSKDVFTMSSLSKKNPIYYVIFTVEFLLNYIVEIVTLNLAKKILCVSEYEYNDTIRKKILKKNSKTCIVRNGTSTELYNSNPISKNALKKELGINSDQNVVMFLGRMVPKNSPMLIMQAVNDLKDKPLNVKYVFVGDGEDKSKLEKYVTDNELSDKVIFTGAISSDKILNIADIFVSHCSSLVDGPGRTTFESMLLGIPVVTGKDYIKESMFSTDEICLINKDDFLEISNEIYKLLTDVNLRNSIGKNAKQKALNEFTLEAHMNKIEICANIKL